MNALVVFGHRTAIEVLESARAMPGLEGWSILQNYYAEQEYPKYASSIEEAHERVFFNVGIASPATKAEVVAACLAREWKPFTVAHPSSVVAESASVGEGCFVGPLAVVSANANVGNHSIVHIHCSIGHDATVGAYSAILPGARVSGNVVIGERTLIGSNAFVSAGKQIGDDCQVDALTYVSKDIDARHIVSCRSKAVVPRIDLK